MRAGPAKRGAWPRRLSPLLATAILGLSCRPDSSLAPAPLAWREQPNPDPEHRSLHAVWGTTDGGVYAVGNEGVVLRRAGDVWTVVDVGTTRHLITVWGSNTNDVFAVGFTLEAEGGVLHFDGRSWIEMPLPETRSLTALWGIAGGKVYAVGGAGSVYALEGAAWTIEYARHGIILFGIWGRARDDIWAVGSSGLILHYGSD